MGRPTRLTPAVAATLLRAFGTGASVADAAAYAGLEGATVYQWIKKGEGPRAKEPYKSFRDQAINAKSKLEVTLRGAVLDVVTRALTKEESAVAQAERDLRLGFQAASWWLERQRPDAFGRKDGLTVAAALEARSHVKIEGGPAPIVDETTARQLGDLLLRLGARDPEPTVGGPT